jgi:hypothetical protein
MSGITDAVMGLEADWPAWQIWVVPRTTGGILWCARRWAGGDDASHTLNAGSPQDLAQMITAQGEGFLP